MISRDSAQDGRRDGKEELHGHTILTRGTRRWALRVSPGALLQAAIRARRSRERTTPGQLHENVGLWLREAPRHKVGAGPSAIGITPTPSIAVDLAEQGGAARRLAQQHSDAMARPPRGPAASDSGGRFVSGEVRWAGLATGEMR